MSYYLVKICFLLTLFHLSISEWVEISKSQSQPITEDVVHRSASIKHLTVETPPKGEHREEGFTTPSSVWIEYQRERFGLSNSNSNPLVVSDAGGLKNSAQIVVPINSQIIHARTKLVVKSSEMPAVDLEVVVTPKVETTSRRHSSSAESVDDAEPIKDTVTAQNVENDDESLMPSMQGFLKFLKTMQKTWIKKSKLSIENKIKLLKHLSDNLMKVIEQQFSVLWQPDRRRKRRGLLDDSTLEFPPEAALMSINFLTFAVFLIKLVLQVVQIVKSKHYNFSGFNINAEVVRNP